MNHFERNFASIFGPESHRRELKPENNHWKRREQECNQRRAVLRQCQWCRGINPERSYCHVCDGYGVMK